MKHVIFFCAVAFLFYAESCNRDDVPGAAPVACMNVSATELVVGDSVVVTSCSKNALETEIYFGEQPFLSKDGAATYTYTKAGTYTITLIAYPTDPRNDISKAEQTVTVLPFQSGEEVTACIDFRNQLNLEVLFINCSQNAATFEWDFGDGSSATEVNPTHTYAAAGEYTVVLKAYASGSKEAIEVSKVIMVELIGNPDACFKPSNTGVTPGEEINFLNCSQNSFRFEWDFGDGTASGLINPSHAYASPGSYAVELKAYAADGSFFDSETLEVKVGERYLTGFRLLSFPATNSSGGTWDPQIPFPLPIDGIGPQPDIKIGYRRSMDANYAYTSVEYDIEKSSLPFEWTLRAPVKIGTDVWKLSIADDEGVFGTEEMLNWSGTLNDIGVDGVVEIRLTGAVLQVLYDIQ